MYYVDLTRTVQNGMPVFPGDPAVALTPHCGFPDAPARVSLLQMGSHTGTHLDAPAHMLADGQTLDTVPVERFFGRAKVVTKTVDLTRLDLTGVDFLLFSFGWEEHFGTASFYTDCPALTPEQADHLAALPLKGIGMDTPSVDNAVTGLHNHHALLNSGLVIVEGLVGLGPLVGQTVSFTALPLKWEQADGAPCRAVAVVEEPDALSQRTV